MGSRVFVTITTGDRRVAVEITDREMRIVEALADSSTIVTGSDRDGLHVFLPRTPGGDFAITADLHSEGEPS